MAALTSTAHTSSRLLTQGFFRSPQYIISKFKRQHVHIRELDLGHIWIKAIAAMVSAVCSEYESCSQQSEEISPEVGLKLELILNEIIYLSMWSHTHACHECVRRSENTFRFSLSTMWGLRNWTQVTRFGSKCWAILLALGLNFECTALNHTVKISTTFLLSPHRWLSLCSAEGMTLRCSRWFSVLPVFSVRVGGGTSSSPYSKWILYHWVISSAPFEFTHKYIRIIN